MSEVNRHSFAEVKAAAVGHWTGILIAAGLAPELLNGRHHPCPGCGGMDRFRFIDTKQDGFFICGGGGDRTAGDGFALLEHAQGMAKAEALRFVADYLGISGREISKADRDAWRRRELLKALAFELEVLRLAACDELAGKGLSPADSERLRLAVDSVRAGLGVLYG